MIGSRNEEPLDYYYLVEWIPVPMANVSVHHGISLDLPFQGLNRSEPIAWVSGSKIHSEPPTSIDMKSKGRDRFDGTTAQVKSCRDLLALVLSVRHARLSRVLSLLNIFLRDMLRIMTLVSIYVRLDILSSKISCSIEDELSSKRENKHVASLIIPL